MTERPKEKPDRYIPKPTAGRILIRLESVERTTKSGLVLLSDSHAAKPTTGYVEEVCDDYDFDGEEYEPLFKKDDLVVFGKFTGSKIKVGDKEYLIINEKDILCRLVSSDEPEAVSRPKIEVRGAAEYNEPGLPPSDGE